MAHDMISVEEARTRAITLAQNTQFLMPVEEVDLYTAIGRIAAADLKSDIDIPPFDNTAMDGFAIVSSSVENASKDAPVELKIIDWVGAGVVSQVTVLPGQAVRIMTGGIMPAGADAVVKIEDVTYTQDGSVGQTVSIYAPVKKTNVREAGGEAKAGETVIAKGELIRPAAVGLLVSTGNVTIPVYERPKVGVISIGTELVDPPAVPEPGKIRNANSYMLGAYIIQMGCKLEQYPVVEDNPEAIRAIFEKAISECDFVVSSGGASNGDFDYAIETVRELGEILYDCVSLRPGKAQAFGHVGGTLVQVLSGNPAAAAVGFQLFARPALRAIQGFDTLGRPASIARLSQTTKKNEARAFYQRGHLELDDNGELIACQEEKQSSAMLSEMNRSSVLIELPEGEGVFEAGTLARCLHLDIEEGTII